MSFNRREFFCESIRLTATAGAAGSLAQDRRAASAQAPATDPPLPIVDTHQHLWDLQTLCPPWLNGAAEVLRKRYYEEEYLEAIHGLNVVKAVYMEIALPPEQHVQEAEHVVGLCQSGKYPTVAAVISGRPNSTEFRSYIQRFQGNPYVKGVRQILHSSEAPPGYCLQATFVQSMRLLGELGMSFDLCLRPAELSNAVNLVDQCPGTRFIVDHCGNADPRAFLPSSVRGGEGPSHNTHHWRRDMSALAKRSQVICKISGVIARVPQPNWSAEMLAPIINHCLDAFGPERVVFGGDWPVCLQGATYREWVLALQEVIRNRTLADQRKLLHDNAVRFYGLT